MGEQSGKYYDAAKMREFCDGWKDLVNNYIEKKSLSDGEFSTFQDTESFRGMTADASKTFVKKGMGRMLSEVAKAQRKMRKAQTEVMELFENMVDPSQNARIEYDTLEMINNDFKELYYIFKDRADNVRKIVDCLNNEFGNYAYFEQPDSQTGIDAFIDLCGGEYDTAGYLRKCQDKLAAFDEQAKALLSGKDTMAKTKKVNSHIVYTKEALAPAPEENVKTVKVTLDPVDNSKATANAKKNAKDEMYLYLQSYYGFTDDEMAYLKANQPGLLSSLYGTSMYSTADANMVHNTIRQILRVNYYDTDKLFLESKSTASGGRFVITENKDYNDSKWWAQEKCSNINYYARTNENIVKMSDIGVLTDEAGRYWVAVGPNVMNPNHAKNNESTYEEMNYGTKIDIVLEDENNKISYLYCVVGECKEHTYPDGIHQTGYAFPNGIDPHPQNADDSVVEFCGYAPEMINGLKVKGIIVYE